METKTQSREFVMAKLSTKTSRKKLGIILLNLAERKTIRNKSKRQFSYLLYCLDSLVFHSQIERNLFYKFIAYIALSKEMAYVPINNTWVLLLHQYTSFASNSPLLEMEYLDGKPLLGEGRINFNRKLNNCIENVLVHLFKLKCKGLKRKRDTSALNPNESLTWSLFPFWLYKTYPKIYKKLSSKEKRYKEIDHISFEQVAMYCPVFVLRKFDAYFENKENVEYIKYLAEGWNIRKAPFISFDMTRKMAYRFHQLYFNRSVKVTMEKVILRHPLMMLSYRDYSSSFSMNEPLIYAFVIGLGGNYKMAAEFCNMYSQINDFDFQKSIVQFLIRNEINDTAIMKRLLGYINHMRRESRREYSLKGRTLASLSRAANDYYAEQERQAEVLDLAERGLLNVHWNGADYQSFNKKEKEIEYKIVQLCTGLELAYESKVMSHCVRSYVHYCMEGSASIWSLRTKLEKEEKWESLVTLEIDMNHKIVQAKAKYNARPKGDWMKMIEKWAEEEKLQIGENL